MQQAQSITSILLLSLLTALAPSTTFAESKAKPVEVKSDPYGVGNPTKYSILRGNTKVTFSHPLAGQFTRAEITSREKNGTQLNRFILSRDRKTYLPVLSFLTSFETHYSKKDDKLCIADPTPLTTMRSIAPKANDGVLIAKKREELTKANFFHTSCFDTDIPAEHRNAIMNAAADVLSTETQDVTPEPKYLRCLEKFGFAHESGTIQALQKISKTNPKSTCSIRLACTTEDLDEGQGKFDDGKCLITIQTSALPERDSYARLIFHELSHSVPVRDGTPLAIIEECCAAGKKCDVLRAFAEKNREGEKLITVGEALDQRNSVLTSTATLLAGTDGEAGVFATSSEIVQSAQKVSLAETHPTEICIALGKPKCATQTLGLYSQLSKFVQACIAINDTPSKSSIAFNPILLAVMTLNAEAQQEEPQYSCSFGRNGTMSSSALMNSTIKITRSDAEITAIDNLDQTSPITWEVPKETTPIRLASTLPDDEGPRPGQGTSVGHTPTRTIASIEPLPDEAPKRSLGSLANRRDVSSGRATALVDTLERAARKVAQTLTPEKIELLQVDRKEIFEADYKPKTKSPHYFVTSSAANPIQVADIGNIQGLSFPNPFANSLPAQGKTEAKLAKSESDANSKLTKATKTSGTVTEKEGTGVESESGTSLTAAVLRNSRATTQAGSFAPETREPSAARTHDFKSMDRTALVRFLTSGYRIVSAELENPDLAKALADERNRIQVHDHENRQIGSMKPEITFIYSSDVGRLVQTRVNREKK
jgi:hypothetical protein